MANLKESSCIWGNLVNQNWECRKKIPLFAKPNISHCSYCKVNSQIKRKLGFTVSVLPEACQLPKQKTIFRTIIGIWRADINKAHPRLRFVQLLQLKKRGVWGFFFQKLFKHYFFSFLVHLDGRLIFELFDHETILKKEHSVVLSPSKSNDRSQKMSLLYHQTNFWEPWQVEK